MKMVKKNPTSVLLLFALFFLGISCSKKNEETLTYDKGFIEPIKHAREEVVQEMIKAQIPASSICITVDGKTVWSEGIGFANLELSSVAKRSTKYRIGNTSKVITSLVYHLLEEQGVFGGDTLVSDYFPEFKNKKSPVTLNHLVAESSGIRPPTSNEAAYTQPGLPIGKSIHKFLDDTLLFEPGRYRYLSDFNYDLLGAIMEKKLNMDFNKLVHKVLLDTLQMASTSVDIPLAVVENRATPYARNMVSRRINALFRDHSPSAPSIGMFSTADDMAKLCNALIGPSIISDSLRAKYFKPLVFNGENTASANGWEILVDRDGNEIYSCKGVVEGGTGYLVVYPSEKIVVAWLTNITSKYEDMPIYNLLGYFVDFKRGKSLDTKEKN